MLTKEETDVNEEQGSHLSPISILTTCRGRERPEDQMWLAGEGFEREEKELKREKEY